MKQMDLQEMKKIQIEMLKYLDSVCRKNDIKYSLIGGSLIGAIRHKGMIPWDDDIDIILLRDEYNKLVTILENTNSENYKVLTYENTLEYKYPYAKLVDMRTYMYEHDTNKVADLGVYVDIFAYDYLPASNFERKLWYYKRDIVKRFNREKILNHSYCNNIKVKVIRMLLKCFPTLGNPKCYDKISQQYNKRKTEYLLSNWPAYGYDKELQFARNFEEFIDGEFEGLKIMIFKNYDDILSTTFGDYMKFPPLEKRVSHHKYDVFWRENINK